MTPHDVAVIRAAETLRDKWKAFHEDSDAEDPDDYAVLLEKAVDARRLAEARRESLESANPNPSITVGTQVRLTGVVESVSNGIVGVDLSKGSKCFLDANHLEDLEVIRQPFERGEVVYHEDTPFVVINDESLGMVDVTNCRTGFYSANDDPDNYERRP